MATLKVILQLTTPWILTILGLRMSMSLCPLEVFPVRSFTNDYPLRPTLSRPATVEGLWIAICPGERKIPRRSLQMMLEWCQTPEMLHARHPMVRILSNRLLNRTTYRCRSTLNRLMLFRLSKRHTLLQELCHFLTIFINPTCLQVIIQSMGRNHFIICSMIDRHQRKHLWWVDHL